MRVLAIDTALANCAVAVLDDSDENPCEIQRAEEIGRGHAERLMSMIGDVMAESSTAFTDLDRVIVTTGPGSFTGLRVGLSVAKGFGLVLEKPVVGVTTLAAIARSSVPCETTVGSSLLVALEGKGDEVYCQLFDASGDIAGEASVQTLTNLVETLPGELRLAGSAARKVADALCRGDGIIENEMAYPDIAEVARLGMVTDPKSATAAPLYLRPPDATPQKKGRIERK
ncbi:tRNA (adenosine(37)-N6)-threonylcarbamoyltransferase complex dimerization subunit type 1 TsaB [Labrenzia sp. CE80]|uniref:tRNA (adenosine(37)-N6)-threonylcarbamoyltransferase complex dimerization subunit type 1 TsaB n=1 Tax=Labrenzia sp. CE80 TaxID=1788986 RepID=UPI00129A223E|nr:tRNA (adenosine(37)-N6)-threonylcarbamoyltransferase complex dimerization subunit type 1 TsaB [Labrenzia sp. CE80]